MTSETSPPPARLLPRALPAAALYGALTLVYLRPIWRVFGHSLTPNAGDPLFSVYILKWVVRQIHAGFPNLWDANFFYPARGTLALSDHMLGPAFEIAFLGNTVAGYNLLVFSSFVLCGIATWWVLRRSGLSGPAALLGGAVFAFSPFRMSHLNHLLMLTMQWIPLTLWSFDRLLAERTPRRAAIFLLFYGLQLTAGCYLAYMIHFPMLAILASRWAAIGRRRLLAPASLRVLAPVAVLAAAALVAIFLPYLRQAKRLDLTHDDHEIGGGGGAALASYLSPAPANLYSLHPPAAMWDRAGLPRWQQPFVRSESSLFPGFLPTLLAAVGLWEICRRYRARPESVAWTGSSTLPMPHRPTAAAGVATARRHRLLLLLAFAGAGLAAVALGDVYTLGFAGDLPPLDRWTEPAAWTGLGVVLLLSLGLMAALRRRWRAGPILRWSAMDPWHRGLLLAGLVSFALSFPIVYFPLMRVVPGLHSMRAPARFDAFLSLTVAFLAAWGYDGLAERWRVARSAVPAIAAAVLLGSLLAIELAPRPVHWVRLLGEEDFPPVYSWIRGRPEIRALVEVPLRPAATEIAYMYYSTRHWKPIANGYSGFVPDSYDELASKVRQLPDGDGFELLERMGISHIVVHGDDLARPAFGEDDEAAEARGAAMIRGWERRFLGRRIELVHADGAERVYRLVPLAATAGAPVVLAPPPLPAAPQTARRPAGAGTKREDPP
jgi:hypothetical protein